MKVKKSNMHIDVENFFNKLKIEEQINKLITKRGRKLKIDRRKIPNRV